MSGSATINVGSLPTTYTVSGGGNYCAGGAGMHIGLSGSTPGISYQPYIGGVATGSVVLGTGSTLDLGARTAAGTYTVLATNSTTGCTNTMSGTATISISPAVSPAVTISTGSGDTVCSGTLTTFTAMAVNGGTSAVYQWKVNGTVTGSGSSYSYIPVNGDVVSVMLTSSATCAMPASASANVSMTVNSAQLPDVTVAATPGIDVCQATTVHFTATPIYGGTAPTYSWILNGVNSGTGTTFSYVPLNGDVVYCIMTSNYHCRLANSASSTHMTMQVDLPVSPIVSITATPGLSIASGQTVMLSAAVTSGGSAPTYQWFINGVAQTGATMPTYASNTFANGDSVSCEVTSSGGCAGITGSSYAIIHVSTTGVNQVTLAGSDIKLIPNPNKGVFAIKGTLGTTNDEEVGVEVTDMLGQVVYNSKVTAHNGVLNETIQLRTLANGMYLVNLHSGAENKVFHIVIER